ncbi:MAG: PHP domain-containing protein [bacterium]
MIDLHTHTKASDGFLTPEELVVLAKERGLKVLGITDHDTVAGLDRAVNTAVKEKQVLIPGVEISIDYNTKGTLHILGLGLDHNNVSLVSKLQYLADSRVERVTAIFGKLKKIGVNVSYHEVAEHVNGVIGRPHIAQVLVNKGYAVNIQDAFERFIGSRGAAYIIRKKLGVRDAVDIIHGAQGLAFLAHPCMLNLSEENLKKYLTELKENGVDGVEGFYSKQPPLVSKIVTQSAEKLGMFVSGGSDFHGDLIPDIQLGLGFGEKEIPDIIWEKLRNHIKFLYGN